MGALFSAHHRLDPSRCAPSQIAPLPEDEKHRRDEEVAEGPRSTQRSLQPARLPKRQQERLDWLRLQRGHLRNSRTPHVTKEKPSLPERPRISALDPSRQAGW